jgi:ATP-binding cassette, subfamily B, multidrug efflux pump
LRDNIGLGEPAATEARMRAAAERVGADRLLARAGGLDAPVTERGLNLSAGERQLICFARALCRDPEVLVLDEATASVDPDTERLIERATRELLHGRTAIVIAHRISTIARVERILVLHTGTIAEQGSHGELLRRNHLYARLYAEATATRAIDQAL